MTKEFSDDSYKENLLFYEVCSCRRLRIMNDGKSVLVLGYRVTMTNTEYTILKALSESEKPISRKEFEADYGLTYSSIPVHISNINKKAFPITRRKMIIGKGCEKYEISPTM